MPAHFQSLAPAPPEPDEMLRRARAFYERVHTRRSVRDLSDRAGSREVIERVLFTAASALSGANPQPWFITALHAAGLATLTHAPSPINFLRTLLNRPENERPAMLVIAGYPENGARGPAFSKEAIDGIVRFV